MIGFVRNSLRNKLMAIVLLLAVVGSAVGAIALNRLDGMNSRIESMAEVSAEKVKLAARMRQALLDANRASNAMIVATDPEQIERFAKHIDAAREDLKEYREALEPLLDDAGRKQLNEFNGRWETYVTVNDRVRDLTRLNSNTRAYSLSTGDASSALGRVETNLREINRHVSDQLEEAAKSDNDQVRMTAELGLKTQAANELLRACVEYQRAEKNLILADSEKEMKQYQQRMAELEPTIQADFERLDDLLAADWRDELDAAQREYERYVELSEQVQDLSLENGNNRAFVLMRDEAAPATAAAETVLAEIVKKNDQDMEADVVESDENYQQAWILMISVLAIGISAAVILAVIVVMAVVRSIKPVVTRAQAIAEGDLTGESLEVRTTDEVGELTRSVNRMSDSLKQMVGEINASSSEVAAAATEISSSAEELSRGLEEQNSQMTQVSSAAEELASSVVEVANKATEASSNAQSAGDKATSGGEIVQQTIQGMQSIDDAVSSGAQSVEQLGKRGDEIGEVIATINEIADQTNLLALNAAIEAARAGEHGKGFAVVADEVRKLADRTVKATEEIATSIQAVQNETGQAVERMRTGTENVKSGVELASQAGDSLREIVKSSQEVSGMIASIASAAEEQSAASEQISKNIQSIDEITRQSVEASQQAASASTELSQRAESLQAMVARFQLADTQHA